MRLVKGSHIIVPKLYHHGDAYTLQHRDGRVVFVLPYEGRYSLIGTTEVDYQGDPGEARITQPEIVYLCDVISRYFREPLKPDRVLWTFAGVRPLYDDAETDVSAVTRDYAFDLDRPAGQAPLLSILGGKITTYRRLAEHALEKLQPELGTASRPWTAKAPLPGGDLPHGDFEAFVDDLHRGALAPLRPRAPLRARLWQPGDQAPGGRETWAVWANIWATGCTRRRWSICAATNGPSRPRTSSGAVPGWACTSMPPPSRGSRPGSGSAPRSRAAHSSIRAARRAGAPLAGRPARPPQVGVVDAQPCPGWSGS